MRFLFVVDVDGTVADSMVRAHAVSLIHDSPDSDHWREKELEMFLDPKHVLGDPVIPGAERLREIVAALDSEMVFLTGRSEDRSRETTRLWLRKKLDIPDSVPLHMRAAGDHRPGWVAKPEILENEIKAKLAEPVPLVFLEDDPKCLREYAKHGIALRSPDCWKALAGMLEVRDVEIP